MKRSSWGRMEAGGGSSCALMLVTVLMVESNYMALCLVECSWNTEQSDPLGVLIKVCVRACVCACVHVLVACLSLEHVITSW